MFSERNANLLLNAASYLVVQRHQERCGEPPTGFHFNKYLSVLQKEAPGNAFRLPHCWYRWGDEVAMQQMPSALRWSHTEPPAAKVTWTSDAPEIPDDPLVEWMEGRIEQLTNDFAAPATGFASSTKLRALIDVVYSYAPFPFQNEYRQLREIFVDLRGASIPLEDINEAILLPTLDRALRVFPSADFPRFRGYVEPFKQVMENLVDHGTNGIQLASEASEAFWFAFCYHLRVHHAANQNVSPMLIREWELGIPQRMHNYERTINSILVEASGKIPAISRNPNASALVQLATEKRARDLAFLDSFDDEFSGLGKFTDTLRKRTHK